MAWRRSRVRAPLAPSSARRSNLPPAWFDCLPLPPTTCTAIEAVANRAPVTPRRDRRVVRWPVVPAHRGRGLTPLRAGAAGGFPLRASRLPALHDAMAPHARRHGSAHSPPGAARRARRRRRCGRSLVESLAPAAGSRPECRRRWPVVPSAGSCHSPRASFEHQVDNRGVICNRVVPPNRGRDHSSGSRSGSC